MSSIAVVLKEEIGRLAKKVVKQAVAPLAAASARHRRDIAGLKRQIAALERELKTVRKGARSAPEPVAANEDSARNRFQAKGLRSLRSKLGLSAADFGKLAGVSGQTIYNWETEKAEPRRAQLTALASIRKIGKREAISRLENSSG